LNNTKPHYLKPGRTQETQTTLGTRHRQHWAQDTEQRQTQHGKTKYEQHRPHQKPGVRNYTHIWKLNLEIVEAFLDKKNGYFTSL
jgi:hypothetical protein